MLHRFRYIHAFAAMPSSAPGAGMPPPGCACTGTARHGPDGRGAVFLNHQAAGVIKPPGRIRIHVTGRGMGPQQHTAGIAWLNVSMQINALLCR